MRIKQENIYFILVEPQTPGNIGAAARALKTMGFKNLVLINPADRHSPEARWMAHASGEILDNAVIHADLQEATAQMNFVVATTQRERGFHLPYFTPVELAKKLVPVSIEHKTAIVFGREQTGLTNQELSLCHAVSTIPAHTRHPSLNLAQAVMVYCYELFQFAYSDVKSYNWNLATQEDLQILFRHLQHSLERVDFEPIDSWQNFTVRFSRLLGRANAEVRDIRVWHKILKSFDQYIDQLEGELEHFKEDGSSSDKGL
jgi:TrmH family RNA methyltransferase